MAGEEEADDTASVASSVSESSDDEPDDEEVCLSCEQPLVAEGAFAFVAACGGHFHRECFVCEECDEQLDSSEYFERRGCVYCKADYLKKFAKYVCAGCLLPFKRGDAAMEACEKMWHPECFACGNCERVFDDEETFYDKDGIPYCGDCNENLFLTCPTCERAVGEDEDGINALGKNYHKECFVCAHCSDEFPMGVYYTKDDGSGKGEQPFCETCYMDLFVPKCNSCAEPVKKSGLAACGGTWHTDCFVCTVCSCAFKDGQYYAMDGLPYCATDYFETFGEKCAKCERLIKEEVLNAVDKSWHPDCFGCAECGEPFPDMLYFERDGQAYCEDDFKVKFCKKCPACEEYVVEGGLEALGDMWHDGCLVCHECNEALVSSAHRGDDGHVYCKEHYMNKFASKCPSCGDAVEGDAVEALGGVWHAHCFVCKECSVDLMIDGKFFELDGYVSASVSMPCPHAVAATVCAHTCCHAS
jgi:hypothetical protein